jgi:hypothetical protein
VAQVRVSHSIGRLAADVADIPARARIDMRDTTREGVRTGNSVAVGNAKRSAGKHGKHYHKALSWEMRPTFSGFGTTIISGEYGPDIAKPQGGMSFETGSRNQKPHLDLARSADIIGPAFAGEVRQLPDRWFW